MVEDDPLNNGLILVGNSCLSEITGRRRDRPENVSFPSDEHPETFVENICPPTNKRTRNIGAGSISSFDGNHPATAEECVRVRKDVEELMRMYPLLANKANPDRKNRALVVQQGESSNVIQTKTETSVNSHRKHQQTKERKG